MPVKSVVGAAALALALVASTSALHAGTWTPVEIKRASPAANGSAVAALATPGQCVWTRWRGWHRTGWIRTWKSCQPGSDWHYERRCWIGPGNVHHCRFYG